ncbi:MAG: segregation and condensation protein A, partial [Akkermansiaceae bacterium]
DVNIFDLIRAFQNVLKRFEESTDLGDIVDDRYTVADKIEYLLGHVEAGGSIQFTSLFVEATSKAEVIVTFLAVLELMKMNQFRIRQDHILGEIEVERK